MDWLNLLGRSLHVIAGIAWIGASFYFIWLDNHLEDPADAAGRDRRGREAPAESNIAGELWAVHGGGFYHSQKYREAPPAMPARLHWFKWEAYTTLLSGLFLLAIVYYAQPETYLIDRSIAQLSPALAVVVGVLWIAGGWLVYDTLCRSALGRNERALAFVLAILCAGAAYALCHTFPGRAAFIHFGAMLGTIMVLNVFFVIIPGQRALVEAARAGRAVDPAWGARGKQRSVHNTYFTLPVVFTMICNHYAWLFGPAWNWLALIAISLAGALIRVFFVMRHKRPASPWPLIAAGALVVALALATMPGTREPGTREPGTRKQPVGGTTSQAQAIVVARCAPCHAAMPTLPGVAAPPQGIVLESEAQIRALAPRIRDQVAARAMPPGNLTEMTDFERELLMAWAAMVAPR